MILRDKILSALSSIIDPDFQKDIVSLGFIKNLTVSDENEVSFDIELTTPACPIKDEFKRQAEKVVMAIDEVTKVSVTMSSRKTAQGQKELPNGLKGVKRIIAVSSCKGGVGKSTVAVNLAYSVRQSGAKVGIFDADIYGPSLPTMVNVEDIRLKMDGQLLSPLQFDGVALQSFGFTQEQTGQSGPAVMRGPMVSSVITQLLTGTNWGELDYLFIDMPPGTGDVQLTLGQLVPLTAAVIVTTPQKISFIDVIKGIQMFDSLNVPTVTVIENMSFYQCDNCTQKHYVFGQGALRSLQDEFGFESSFELPIQFGVSYAGDNGVPLVIGDPSHEVSQRFNQISASMIREVEKATHQKSSIPTVTFIRKKGVCITTKSEHQYIQPYVLRKSCQCAHCVEEFTGRDLTSETSISKDVFPADIAKVGNYAVGINWSDGHSSLYPYKQLFTLISQLTAQI